MGKVHPLATVHWNYDRTSEDGPLHWGEIMSEGQIAFPICASGMHQSPINLDHEAVKYSEALKDLTYDYAESVATTITNNGHTVQVDLSTQSPPLVLSGGNLQGNEYHAAQFHFHAPSEHRTDSGAHFPLELHIVHTNADTAKSTNDASLDQLAVVGILFKEGKHSEFLEPIVQAVMHVLTSGSTASVADVMMNELIQGKTYFNYQGSLTTPNCRETVRWHVLSEPLEASWDQIMSFIMAFGESQGYNHRPTQPLNGRVILTNDEKFKPVEPTEPTDDDNNDDEDDSSASGTTINVNFAGMFSKMP
jgi:carbonic anhydrase